MSRILFVMNTFPSMGGIESVTHNLINELGKEHDIFVVAQKSTKGVALPQNLNEIFYFDNVHSLLSCVRQYNSIIAENKITHVINQGMFRPLTNIIFNKHSCNDVKVISVLHGKPGYEKMEFDLKYKSKKESAISRTIRKMLICTRLHGRYRDYFINIPKSYRIAALNSDKVVLLTEQYIADFCSEYGLKCDPNRMIAIGNPLSEDYSHITKPDFVKKENIILFVGRLAKEKNIELIIHAWGLLQGKLAGWKLVIVGNGYLEDALKKSAEGLQDIEFAGSCPNPGIYYEKAKMILLTSWFEGYPMALMEAQRYGVVPVAYPSSAGVSDILSNGGGVPIPKYTPESIAATILSLAQDQARLKVLSSSAYDKSSAYELKTIADQWRELLK